MPAYRYPEIRIALRHYLLNSDLGGRKGEWTPRKSHLLAIAYQRAIARGVVTIDLNAA